VHLVGSMCNWTKMHGIHDIKIYFGSLDNGNSLLFIPLTQGLEERQQPFDWALRWAELTRPDYVEKELLCVTCWHQCHPICVEVRMFLHVQRWGQFLTLHYIRVVSFLTKFQNKALFWRLTLYSVEVKVRPRRVLEGPDGEKKYSSTLSLTSALHGFGWLRPRPGRITPGNDAYPLYRKLGGRQGLSGRVQKISTSPGFDPRTVQPVASRYIDWAIPAHIIKLPYFKWLKFELKYA
jgi:hypothetical protein